MMFMRTAIVLTAWILALASSAPGSTRSKLKERIASFPKFVIGRVDKISMATSATAKEICKIFTMVKSELKEADRQLEAVKVEIEHLESSNSGNSKSDMSTSCGNGLQENYRGSKNTTRFGKECQRWDAQSPHKPAYTPEKYPQSDLVENFCRNPSNSPAGAWCYTMGSQRWDYCQIPPCDFSTSCGDGLQKNYRGTTNTTKSGKACQRWDAQSPHGHVNTPERFPQSDLVENYCRNPDNWREGLWCYTMENTRWESCGIPQCGLANQLNAFKVEIKDLEAQVKELKSLTEDLQADLDLANRKIKDLQNKIKSLKVDIEALKVEKENLKEDLAAKVEKIRVSNVVVWAQERILAAQEKKIGQLKEDIANQKESIATRDKKIVELKTKLGNCQSIPKGITSK